MASEDDERSSLQRPDDESHYRQVFRSFTTAGNARLHVGNSYVQYDVRIPRVLYVAITIGLALLLAAYAGSLKSLAGAVAGYIPRSDITERLRIGEGTRNHHRTALYGMGGVGKTQLAVDYAYDFHARRPDVTILWLYASTFDRFLIDYLRVGALLGLPAERVGNRSELELVFDHLSDYRNGNWLMIIDNLDVDWHDTGPTPLDYIPETLGCRAILTTRDRNIAEQFASDCTAVIAVDILTSEQAYELVVSALRPELILYDLVATLGESYGYLPLALSQAAAYMNYFDTPLDRYIGFIKAEPNRLLELHAPGLSRPRNSDSSQSVYAAFRITFDRLSLRHPRAVFLLKVMACFDSQSMPETLLRSHAYPSEQEFAETIGLLLALSLVRRSSEGYTGGWCESSGLCTIDQSKTPLTVYSMHRLVNVALRKDILLSSHKTTDYRDAVDNVPSGSTHLELVHLMSVATLSLTKAWRLGDDDLALNHSAFNIRPHAYKVLFEPLLSPVMSFDRALLWYFFGRYVWNAAFLSEVKANRATATSSTFDALSSALSILEALPGPDHDRIRRRRWRIVYGVVAPLGSISNIAPDKGPRVLFSGTLNTTCEWRDLLTPLLDCIASTLESQLLQELVSEDADRRPTSSSILWTELPYKIYRGVGCDGEWAIVGNTGEPRLFTSITERHIWFMKHGCSNPIVDVAAWYSSWVPDHAAALAGFDMESTVNGVRGNCGAVVTLDTTYVNVDANGLSSEAMCGRGDGPRLPRQIPIRSDPETKSLAEDKGRHWLGRAMDFFAAPSAFLLNEWSQVSRNFRSLLFDVDDDDHADCDICNPPVS